jgi:hypothetical protein
VVVGRNPELARADENAVPGRDFHAVAVAGERRPDCRRGYVLNQVSMSESLDGFLPG